MCVLDYFIDVINMCRTLQKFKILINTDGKLQHLKINILVFYKFCMTVKEKNTYVY